MTKRDEEFYAHCMKYCDKHVCLSVCLSVRDDISGATRAIFTKFHCCRVRRKRGQSIGMEAGDGSAHSGRSVIYDCLLESKLQMRYKNMKSFSRIVFPLCRLCSDQEIMTTTIPLRLSLYCQNEL